MAGWKEERAPIPIRRHRYQNSIGLDSRSQLLTCVTLSKSTVPSKPAHIEYKNSNLEKPLGSTTYYLILAFPNHTCTPHPAEPKASSGQASSPLRWGIRPLLSSITPFSMSTEPHSVMVLPAEEPPKLALDQPPVFGCCQPNKLYVLHNTNSFFQLC